MAMHLLNEKTKQLNGHASSEGNIYILDAITTSILEFFLEGGLPIYLSIVLETKLYNAISFIL
jgi:hypothetical protein